MKTVVEIKPDFHCINCSIAWSFIDIARLDDASKEAEQLRSRVDKMSGWLAAIDVVLTKTVHPADRHSAEDILRQIQVGGRFISYTIYLFTFDILLI